MKSINNKYTLQIYVGLFVGCQTSPHLFHTCVLCVCAFATVRCGQHVVG